MKQSFSVFCLLALACALPLRSALAGASTTQTVTYEVVPINEISDSGDPGGLTISTATAGSEPDSVSDATTTYSITTNGTNKKITGAIDTVMPANTALSVNLQAPTGGTSAGAVTLTNVAQDLVTGVTKLAEGGKTITYGLSATSAAGIVGSASKTVTLTVTDGGG